MTDNPKIFPPFPNDEFLSLSLELEKHHGVFYHLWQMGHPQFTDKVSTAGVTFDKVGEVINFWINPEFWATQTPIQKQFVICHECGHIILNHGKRMQNNGNPDLTNQALDVVVNHSLVDRFGFDRKEVDPTNKYCWLDTVFDPKDNIPPNKTFEFYFNKLNIKAKQDGNNGNGDGQGSPGDKKSPGGNILDDHEKLGDSDFGKVIEQLNEDLSDGEKDGLKAVIQKHFEPEDNKNKKAGTGTGGMWVFAKGEKVKKKKKWETVIKKWAMKFMKDDSEEQWVRTNRRMLFFDGDLIIPTEADTEGMADDRIQVWFFQDTSGSCSGFVDRFFNAASSLPTDRFDVKMHCFDTQVFETTLESKKLYGFGGTSFKCIEDYIQSYCKKHNCNYPKAVFCITDGYGDIVKPQNPTVWYWFLSCDYKYCIPKESKVFMLKDFE